MDTDFTADKEKSFEMETKIDDKGVSHMLQDGGIDAQMGMAMPGSSSVAITEVKNEENEDIGKMKQVLSDLKST